MKTDQKSRNTIGVVIIFMMVLAVLSYILPGTLAAYLFPGISRVGAVEVGKLTMRSPYSLNRMSEQRNLVVSARAWDFTRQTSGSL